jgi:hypothetical protein
MTAAVTTEWDLRQFQQAVEESLNRLPGAAGRLFRSAWELLSSLPLDQASTTPTAARSQAPPRSMSTGVDELRRVLAELRDHHERLGEDLRRVDQEVDQASGRAVGRAVDQADGHADGQAVDARQVDASGRASVGTGPSAVRFEPPMDPAPAASLHPVDPGMGASAAPDVESRQALLQQLAGRAAGLRDRAENVRRAAAEAAAVQADPHAPKPTLLHTLARQVGAWLTALGQWLARRATPPPTTNLHSSAAVGPLLQSQHQQPTVGPRLDLDGELRGLVAGLDLMETRLQWVDDRLRHLTGRPHPAVEPENTQSRSTAPSTPHPEQDRPDLNHGQSPRPGASTGSSTRPAADTPRRNAPAAEATDLLIDRGQLHHAGASPSAPEDLSDLALASADLTGAVGDHDLGGLT